MSDPSSSWTIERVLLWAVRGGLFLIPVVALLVGGYGPFDLRVNTLPGAGHLVLPNLFFSYIAWKNFAFRMIVEVVIGLWIGLAAIAPRYRPRLSPVTIAVSALLGIIAIADFAGVAPTRSIWSNFERMQGLMGLLYLYAFFLVASSTMDRKAWFWFFHVSLGVCVLVSYDAVREWSVPAPQAGQPDLFGGRVGGKFGSPVHLACYLLFPRVPRGVLRHAVEEPERPGAVLARDAAVRGSTLQDGDESRAARRGGGTRRRDRPVDAAL